MLPPVIGEKKGKSPWSMRAYSSAGPVTVTRADGTTEAKPPKQGGDRSFVSDMPEGFSKGGKKLKAMQGPGERPKNPYGGDS